MSRVGKRPVVIPSGVKASMANGIMTIQGPKGKLEFAIDPVFTVEIKNNAVCVIRPSDERKILEKHGTTRTRIYNMIVGVTQGYVKQLEIQGVGFKAQSQGKKITFNLGYSHPISYDVPDGLTIETPKPTQVVISGIDKAKVGEVAAEIREFYLPEPYKGKGIRYVGEYVRRKAGKTVA